MVNNNKLDILKAGTNRFWDIILLNILFVFSCLPVITYGAAITALYASVHEVKSRQYAGGAFSLYFSSFKKNLVQSTKLWSILLVAFLLLFIDCLIAKQMPGLMRYSLMGLLAFVLVLMQVITTVGFPLVCKSELSTAALVRCSFLVLAKAPFKTLLACILQALPFVVAFFMGDRFAAFFILWVTVYFSVEELLILLLLDQTLRVATKLIP